VIVPNYNGGILLDESLRSMLELDYPKDPLEIIMVDGIVGQPVHKWLTLIQNGSRGAAKS
jgi:cellulose synthase/poly-beta-1,6-N-acetylglucosamine synthase-like glycosyltransferase